MTECHNLRFGLEIVNGLFEDFSRQFAKRLFKLTCFLQVLGQYTLFRFQLLFNTFDSVNISLESINFLFCFSFSFLCLCNLCLSISDCQFDLLVDGGFGFGVELHSAIPGNTSDGAKSEYCGCARVHYSIKINSISVVFLCKVKNLLISTLLTLLHQSKLTLTCLETKFDQSVLFLGFHRLLTRDNASCLVVFEVALGESTWGLIGCAMHDLCS